MNDTTRAAIMLVVTNAIAAAQLFGLVDWSGDQVAGLGSLVSSTLILVAYLLKNGQQASGTSSAIAVVSTPVNDPPKP